MPQYRRSFGKGLLVGAAAGIVLGAAELYGRRSGRQLIDWSLAVGVALRTCGSVPPLSPGERVALENRYRAVLERIEEHGLPMAAFEWYLDLRRYGSVPHAGFGMGIERTLTWICGLDHLRETIPFPRLLHRMHP